MNKTNTNKISEFPEIVGSGNQDSKQKVYEVERLINTLAAIIEKYAGQLDTAQ